MLGYLVTGLVTIVLLFCLSKAADIRMNHRAKRFYRYLQFDDGEFRYARWAKVFEFTIPFIFAMIALIYLFVYDFSYIIFFFFAGCSFFIALRFLSWRTERIVIEDYTLRYYRQGVLRKEVDLNLVEDVTIAGLRLTIVLKDESTLEIPMGFQHLTVLYAILKYHRPDGRETHVV